MVWKARNAPNTPTPATASTPASTPPTSASTAPSSAKPVPAEVLHPPVSPQTALCSTGALNALKQASSWASAPTVPASEFPIIALLSGANGGFFDAVTPREDLDLPVGREPIVGILVGYRLRLVLWPTAAESQPQGDRPKPLFSMHIDPAHPNISFQNILEGLQRYQMRKNDKNLLRQLYDPVGHPQGTLELLMATNEIGFFVVRTCPTYSSVIDTLVSLASVYEAANTFQPEAVSLTPVTKELASKKYRWKEHSISVSVVSRSDPTIKVHADALMHWLTAPDSPYPKEKIESWLHPVLTTEQNEALLEWLTVR